jgi:exopolysaccharide production protein ExoZ
MIWSLQSLRFVAALMVVYVHAAQAAYTATGSTGLLPYNIVSVGLSGVDLFLVLSGVVIAKAAPGLTAAEFVWRRIRRVVPIYSCAASRPFSLRCRMASYGERCWQRSYCGQPPT